MQLNIKCYLLSFKSHYGVPPSKFSDLNKNISLNKILCLVSYLSFIFKPKGLHCIAKNLRHSLAVSVLSEHTVYQIGMEHLQLRLMLKDLDLVGNNDINLVTWVQVLVLCVLCFPLSPTLCLLQLTFTSSVHYLSLLYIFHTSILCHFQYYNYFLSFLFPLYLSCMVFLVLEIYSDTNIYSYLKKIRILSIKTHQGHIQQQERRNNIIKSMCINQWWAVMPSHVAKLLVQLH